MMLKWVSEAIGAVLRLAFQDLGLNRVHAYHMVRNPASGRVLADHCFLVEGMLRERVRKWGVFEDSVGNLFKLFLISCLPTRSTSLTHCRRR